MNTPAGAALSSKTVPCRKGFIDLVGPHHCSFDIISRFCARFLTICIRSDYENSYQSAGPDLLRRGKQDGRLEAAVSGLHPRAGGCAGRRQHQRAKQPLNRGIVL